MNQPFEILIAEDNPADVALVREALKLHDVDSVLHVLRDGEQALALLDSLDKDPKLPRVDLLILDMHLPKHDGEEILKRLRSTEHYAQTPVIVLTAHSSTSTEAKATKNAALFYFRKPSTLDELSELGAMVRNVLDPSSSRVRQPPPLGSGTAGGKQ
ncbi:MAG: response regulator [Bdellovibrionota bacterium]